MSCIMLQFQPGWAKDAVREEDIIKARKEEEEKQGIVPEEEEEEPVFREPEFTGNFGQDFLSSKLGQKSGFGDEF